MAPGSSLRYEDTFSLLYVRDACSDAFGPNASDQTCSPSLTLCCVRRGQEFPSCQKSLGKGWCCVGTGATDNCYVDQPSVCEEQNSVPCVDLAEGTDEACCPPLTSCGPGYPATKERVRCNIKYSDLQRAAGLASSSSSSSSTARATSRSTTSSSLATSSATSSAELFTTLKDSNPLMASSTTGTGRVGNAAQTLLPADANSQGQGTPGLSGAAPGLIAGAAVGGTLGFVALLVLGYLILRRVLKMKQQGGYAAPPPGASQPVYRRHDYSQATTVVEPPGYRYPGRWAEPVEVMTKHEQEPVELPTGR